MLLALVAGTGYAIYDERARSMQNVAEELDVVLYGGSAQVIVKSRADIDDDVAGAAPRPIEEIYLSLDDGNAYSFVSRFADAADAQENIASSRRRDREMADIAGSSGVSYGYPNFFTCRDAPEVVATRSSGQAVSPFDFEKAFQSVCA